MGYIGRTPTGSILTGADIADGSISTAKLADTAVSTAKIADTAISTAKIADDAVGNTKLDLTANYAFTGSITGAGGMVLVDSGNGTSATNLSIQSKFTSDYTNYKLVATLTPVADGNDLKGRLMIGSSASSDSEYRYRVRSWRRNSSSNDEANQTGWGADHFRLNTSGISNNTQFGANVVLYIFNPLTQSSTNTPNDCHLMGETFVYADNGYIAKSVLGVNYQTSSNFDGIRLEFSSDNIARYNYSLFGITGS